MTRYRIVHDRLDEEFRAEIRVWWWWETLGYGDDRAQCEALIQEHLRSRRGESVVWEGDLEP